MRNLFRPAKFIRFFPAFALFYIVFTAITVQAEILPVKTYLSSDGLIYEKISSIHQDSRGFIWFTSSIGMSRFDGYNFVNYGLENGVGLLVMDIVEDADGIYWFASNGDGVYRFDPQTGSNSDPAKPPFEKISISDEAGANQALKFFKTSRGEIFVGTTAGVFMLHRGEKKFERVIIDPLKAVTTVTAFAEDAQGSLWIGYSSGLARRLPDGNFVHYEVSPSSNSDFVRSLAVDQQNRLWIVNDKYQLVVFNPDSVELASESGPGKRRLNYRPENKLAKDLPENSAYLFTAAETPGDATYRYVYASKDGHMWLAAFGKGLIEFDGNEFRLYDKTNGLSDNSVLNISEDNFGNLWIGSNWGAMRINRKSLISYRLEDGLASERISGIWEDRDRTLYAATPNWNLHRFEGNRFTNVKLNLPENVGNWLTDRIMVDHAGNWWFATGAGLYRFSNVDRIESLKTARPAVIYKKETGLPSDRVRVIFEDSRGDVWLSFEDRPGHVTRWIRSSNQFQTFTPANGVPDTCTPQVFRESPAGDMFFSCYSQYVVRISGENFTVLSDDSFSRPVWISDILVDRRGRLWIATPTGGLVFIENPAAANPPIVKVYTPSNGLSMLNTLFLTEDDSGRIYCETGNGLDLIEPESGKIKHYTLADGLSATGNGLAFRDARGNLWFGAHRGISQFAPPDGQKHPPPPVYIGGIRAGGRSVPISLVGESEVENLTLESDARQLQISFFGIALASGENLRYQYKLEGSDADWSELSSERTANYPNIPAGNYKFLVRAVNSEGLTSLRPAFISFTVLRPFWQRWWFLILAALAMATVIYLLYRYRVNQIIKLERVRTRIATDLHDDIGSSLSKIAILSEVVRQRSAENKASEPLAVIADTSREMVDSMSDIVWAINPERDHLSDLLQRMRRFAEDMLDSLEPDISYRFTVPENLKDLALGADLRREVYMIFKECINNLAKYSGATDVQIELRLENDSLIIEVRDNGRGFDLDAPDKHPGLSGFGGNGLNNMRRRAERLGGKLSISSAAGRGTSVRMQVPTGRKFFAV